MEKGECKRDSNFCAHFAGDIFNTEHISRCYKYCSYCEDEDLVQNEEPRKSKDSTVKQ